MGHKCSFLRGDVFLWGNCGHGPRQSEVLMVFPSSNFNLKQCLCGRVCHSVTSNPDCTQSRIAFKADCTQEPHLSNNKTSTLTPFVKPRSILNLAIWNVFYIRGIRFYVQFGADLPPYLPIHKFKQQPSRPAASLDNNRDICCHISTGLFGLNVRPCDFIEIAIT